jgi:hypothetical protein
MLTTLLSMFQDHWNAVTALATVALALLGLFTIGYESAMIATFLAHAADDQTVDDYADYFMFRNWRDHELAVQLNPEAAKAFPPDFLAQMK